MEETTLSRKAAGGVAHLVTLAIVGLAIVTMACGGNDGTNGASAEEPSATAVDAGATPPEAGHTFPAIIADFLILEGSEHFPAIPPCTGYQAEDEETEDSPLTVGFVPEGAEPISSIVSYCPDGTILGATRAFETAPGRELHVFYTRAPYSFPIVLANQQSIIEEIEVNGQRGLLITQEPSATQYAIPVVRFWVDEQDSQDAGAYVQVSWNSENPDVADLLIEVAESVVVDDPTDPTP